MEYMYDDSDTGTEHNHSSTNNKEYTEKTKNHIFRDKEVNDTLDTLGSLASKFIK